MDDDDFSAFVSAWRVTCAASVILCTALAIAPIWNYATYLSALHAALIQDHY